MKPKKNDYIAKNMDESIIYYAKKKLRDEKVINYDCELANLIDFWRKRILAFNYFVLVGYKNNVPIYESITTGITNILFDLTDDDSTMMNLAYEYILEHGKYAFISNHKVSLLEDAYLAYEEAYAFKDKPFAMTDKIRRILAKK